MSLVDLIIDLENAKTPEDKEKAYAQFHARQQAGPTDAEIIRDFLKDCTDNEGKPLIKEGEYADLVDGKIVVKKHN